MKSLRESILADMDDVLKSGNFCTSLNTLEGAPKGVGGEFRCHFYGKQFTKDEVKSLCDVRVEIYT